MQLGNTKEATKCYEQAASCAIDLKDFPAVESFYKTLAQVHQDAGTIDQYKLEKTQLLEKSAQKNDAIDQLQNQTALGAIAKLQGNYDESIYHFSEAFKLAEGKVDYKATRVEQHEVGISNNEKIGTDNIQQCVVVIIHDPKTKKSALAHVDVHTDPSSLSDVIKGDFTANTPLEVRLVGGRDRSGTGKEVSDGNIDKVVS